MNRVGIGRRRAVVGMIAAALAAVSGTAAQAATTATVTFTGTLNQLLDKDALLGTQINTLQASNLAFVDTFVFDLGQGLRITQAGSDNLLGGSVYWPTNPLVSSKLTINGVTLDFLGTYASQFYEQAGSDVQGAAIEHGPSTIRTNIIDIRTNAPGVLTTNYSGTSVPSNFFHGFAGICNAAGGNCVEDRFDAWFEPQTVTVSVVTTNPDPGPGPGTGPVPEPATWALVIAGFGLAGGVLRRRVAA